MAVTSSEPLSALCLYIVLCFIVPGTHHAKILLYPATGIDSHMQYFSIIGQELSQAGHQVYMLSSPGYHWNAKAESAGITVLTWHKKGKEAVDILNDLFHNNPEFYKSTLWSQIVAKVSNVASIRKIDRPFNWLASCTSPLEDVQLLKKLDGLGIELAIYDGVPLSRCQYVLAYKLGVPFVTLTTSIDPWLVRTPALPSFIPFSPANVYPERMTLKQRIHNIWRLVCWTVHPDMSTMDSELVTKYVPENPFKSLTDIARESLLWLTNYDPLLDYVRPYMPNFVPTGGLSTRPSKPLPLHIENFLTEAPRGVIVVSFGSVNRILPDQATYILVNMFSFLDNGMRVIWKYESDNHGHLPNNTMKLPWIPQNDILGHNKTLLFITHCGNNGQFEALYHGVPMIGLPLVSDQRYNALRMEDKGYGIGLHLDEITPDSLFHAVSEVLNNASYKANIQKASKIYRSRLKHPKQRALDMIEHVIKFGGRHLHSHGTDNLWYEYLMCDILISIFLIIIFIIGIFSTLCKVRSVVSSR